jgi:hypothetical protein
MPANKPPAEWPVYEFVVTVQPRLTEHEGFDPEYVQRKIRSLICAGLDQQFERIIVKRRKVR